MNCGTWDYHFPGREPENNYYFKLDGKKYLEIKFKTTESPLAFEAFFMSKDSSFHRNNDINVYKTSKGAYVDEIDLVELSTIADDLGKNHIKMRGWLGVFTKDGNHTWSEGIYESTTNLDYAHYVKNKSEWCDNWHVFSAEMSPTGMTLYLDGKKYKTLKWGKTLGEIPPDQEFTFCMYRKLFPGWNSEYDFNKYNEHDLKVDYLRIYSESK